jgi:spermidine synthase
MPVFTDVLNKYSSISTTGILVRSNISQYQKIEIIDTDEYGRVLRIDDMIMTSTKDEFIYHELMSHYPMAHHFGNNVLIIGGGDGGLARELLKYPKAKVTMCELDQSVVEMCIVHLNIDDGALMSDRVHKLYGDAHLNMRRMNKKFDMIFMDVTDVDVDVSSYLYSDEGLRKTKSHLSDDGLLTLHLGSPIFHKNQVETLVNRLKSKFKYGRLFGTYIPTYGSYWLFAMVGDSLACRSRPLPPDLKFISDFQDFSEYNPKSWRNFVDTSNW